MRRCAGVRWRIASDAAVWMRRQPPQKTSLVQVGILPVKANRRSPARHRRYPLADALSIGKPSVAAPTANPTDSVFDPIAIDRQRAINEAAHQQSPRSQVVISRRNHSWGRPRSRSLYYDLNPRGYACPAGLSGLDQRTGTLPNISQCRRRCRRCRHAFMFSEPGAQQTLMRPSKSPPKTMDTPGGLQVAIDPAPGNWTNVT